MQVTQASYTQTVNTTPYSGNTLPPTGENEVVQESSLIHELAKSIDPTNMSRNEARMIANALMKSGEGDLSSAFMTQSMVLKVNADGSYSNPTDDDPLMTTKFNMFDSLKGQMEFNREHNLPTDLLEEAESFLRKLQVAKNSPRIDTYT